MISKCSNIVINRTKFSDFEEFDTSTQSTEGLKLVGYIETIDPLTGNAVKKNIAIDYPAVKIVKPKSYFVPTLADPELNGEFMEVRTLSDGSTSYHVLSGFQGDMIQLNFNESACLTSDNGYGAFNKVGDHLYCFTISFAKDIQLGQEIKILFKNFPIYVEGTAVRMVDFTPNRSCVAGIQSSEILFEFDERFKEMWIGNTFNSTCECNPCTCKPFNFLVTFKQTMVASATNEGASQRKMIATNIELVD